MDDIPNLAALRAQRMESDAEYIDQLEQLTIGMEQERVRLHDALVTLAVCAEQYLTARQFDPPSSTRLLLEAGVRSARSLTTEGEPPQLNHP
jgi:hypothetical protein